MNNLYCLVGITLLFSSIYMMFINKNDLMFVEFNQMLNKSQRKKYLQIINERIMIYTLGTVIGIMLGSYYIYNIKNIKGINVCLYLSIVLVTQLVFYKIYPKSKLMLYYLNTKEQTDKWADIYTNMKSRWIKSIIFGFIGYLIIGCSFYN